jgi:plastocyanin
MKKNKLWIGAVVVLVVIIAVVGILAHSNKSGNMNMDMSSSATSDAVAIDAVTIKDYMFGPKVITVKAGTKVTWTNTDAVSHTITADTPSSDAPSSMDIAQGKSFSFTFTKAGTYTYHCFPHPYMHGTVVVTN